MRLNGNHRGNEIVGKANENMDEYSRIRDIQMFGSDEDAIDLITASEC